jgi:hypothetical protein
MESKNEEDKIIVTLSPQEFWWLAKFFGPGVIFGVEDPTEGLSEEEIKKAEAAAIGKLTEANVIHAGKDGTLLMDDLLGAIIYSCVHSNDVMVLTFTQSERRFYHFLPDWQLELVKIKDEYHLTCFKNREVLVDYILTELLSLKDTPLVSKDSFSLPSKDLELATFLFQSGKTEKAVEELSRSCIGQLPDLRIFLEGYVNPSKNVDIQMIYNKEGKKLLHQCHYSIMEIGPLLYWLTHSESIGDEPLPVTHIKSVNPKEVRNKLMIMIGYPNGL